ncbi:uncharacterized protein LOC9658956 [Selaginella moellendorffii]|nr:uncharacterized protein LOC9658956 [Selaginella moellendorffii]|eukprot:XP_002978681.2 uncharacterized protein LOC9658956 [Selaginella moellendorffii]
MPCLQVKKKQQTVPVEDTSQKLRLELLKTWTTVERLEKAHTAAKSKLERLSSRYEDGRSLWESQVQDKITSSLQAMRHKLKEEKNANKSLELANQKLEAELLEIRKAIAQAKKDIVAERNSKRMIEDVCDELAKEVGDDKALAIELRRQASAARREAEETRKALQMGEVWKEEKVQGRLAEARFGIEHRNSELDGAIARVEGFLDNRKKLVEKAMDSSSTVVAENSSTGSSPRSSSQSFDKRIYKEQTRLLLNGSGFHMRNKAYGSGGVKNGVRTPAIPKIWPTSKSPNFD